MAEKRKKKPLYVDKPELHQKENCPCNPAIFCDPTDKVFGYFELIHKKIRH